MANSCSQSATQPAVRSQAGFALLTVLLVVAVVSLLTAQMFSSQHSQIQRSSVMLHQAQVLSVQWGLEDWVKVGLKLDADNNEIDHLAEMWAQPLPPVSFEAGQVGGQLIDAQSKINLNNVLSAEQTERTLWQGILNRYWQQSGDMQAWQQTQQSLMIQGLETASVEGSGISEGSVSSETSDSNQALQDSQNREEGQNAAQAAVPWPGFAEVITDWVDADSEPLPLGAESDQYQLQTPAFSAPNQPIVTVDALYNFAPFTQLSWSAQQVMLAGLTALPKVTPINVNTATSGVLQALAPWMTPVIVQAWQAQRQAQPAETVDEFMQFLEQQTGFTAQEIAQDLPAGFLSVRSEFFQLTSVLDYGSASNQVIYSLYYRSADEVQLVQRWMGYAKQ